MGPLGGRPARLRRRNRPDPASPRRGDRRLGRHSPAHAETEADRAESAEAARRYLEATFAEVRDRAERAGVEVQHEIVAGEDPAEVLLEYAHEHGLDLLVCGHHHERRAGRLLLRGVAGDLVGRSRVPILVVTEPA